MLARVLVAVAAVLVLAWSAVLIRDVRIGENASARLFLPGLSAREIDTQLGRLDDAQLLNPDRAWRLQAALYQQGFGRARAAIAAAERYLRGEPDNLKAWVILLRAAQQTRDAPRVARATAEIKRLNPLAGSAPG